MESESEILPDGNPDSGKRQHALVVQVKEEGKKRDDVTVPRVAQNPEFEAAVLSLDAVKLALGGKAARKVIVVPMRMVNVVG
jgi:leucyl-tRNA synthetase